MARRHLGRRVTSGVADSLSQALLMLAQNNMLNQRQQKQTEQVNQRQVFDDIAKLPADVPTQGPETVGRRFDILRRQLTPDMQKNLGDIDFASMDSPEATRMAPAMKRATGFEKPEDAPDEFELGNLLSQGRVQPHQMTDDKGVPLDVDEQTASSDNLSRLLAQVKQRAEALTTQRDAGTEQMVPGVDENGTPVSRSMTRAQRQGAGPIITGQTSAQKVAEAGQTAGAQENARISAQGSPQAIRSFATRAEAESYARQRGSLRADQQVGAGSFKPTTQVVEATDAQGNKTFKVINTSPGAIGSEVSGGQTPTSDAERTAFGYANRGATEHATMLKLEPILARRGLVLTYLQAKSPETVTDPTMRAYAQAARRFINASLGRPESGGAITPEEFAQYGTANAFVAGDDVNSLKNKQNARREALVGQKVKAGRMGDSFVTMSELTALANQTGTSVQQKIQEAEASGYRVIR